MTGKVFDFQLHAAIKSTETELHDLLDEYEGDIDRAVEDDRFRLAIHELTMLHNMKGTG